MSNEQTIVIRRKKVVAGGHHGGAWKVAYADFVTAMMAFFLMLWLLSTPDKDKLKGIAKYFQPSVPSADNGQGPGAPRLVTDSAGGTPESARADAPSDPAQPSRPSASSALDLKLALMATPEAQAMQRNIRVEPSREGTRIQIMDTAGRPMFRPDTAALNPYAVDLLRMVGRQLGTRGARIAIEGHTDSLGAADRNWRLSGDRAQAARAVLTGAGVTDDRVAEVVALGGTRPAFPEDPGRAENRRVTILVLSERSLLPSGFTAAP